MVIGLGTWQDITTERTLEIKMRSQLTEDSGGNGGGALRGDWP